MNINNGIIIPPVKSCSVYPSENMTTTAQTKSLDSIDSINLDSLNSAASPLLFTLPNGAQGFMQGFVHDTYRDFFLAKYFADNLNSEKISVEEAYTNHWSYDEDKALWKLDENVQWKSFLRNWKSIIMWMGEMLLPEKAEELIDVGLTSVKHYINTHWSEDYLCFFGVNHHLRHRNYNPFLEEMVFLCRFAGESKISTEKHTELTEMIKSLLHKRHECIEKRLFSALAWTKSESSLSLLKEYLFGHQYNLFGNCGPDGPFECYATIIYPMLQVINTDRANEIISEYKITQEHAYFVLTPSISATGWTTMAHYESWMRKGYDSLDSNWCEHKNIAGLRQELISTLDDESTDYSKIRSLHSALRPRGLNPIVKELSR